MEQNNLFDKYKSDPRFNAEQLQELRRGLELELPVHLYAHPHFTAAEMETYRTFLETARSYDADENYARGKEPHFIVTEYGPEDATYGFKSHTNYSHHSERVCYIPENWDFDEDGPGYTGQDFLELCGGDKDKADMVFYLCGWEHPSTVLDQWDHDDDLALAEIKERKVRKLQEEISGLRRDPEEPERKPSLADQITGAENKKASQVEINEHNGTGWVLENMTAAWRAMHEAFLALSEINEGSYSQGQAPLHFTSDTSSELSASLRDLTDVMDKLSRAANGKAPGHAKEPER